MGAEPYQYTVPYEEDIQSALEKLRAEVFASGQFNGAEFNPATPEEAVEMAEEDGTRSILDIMQVSDTPDFCCAAPLSSAELHRYFGTDKPTPAHIEQSLDFWEEVQRGQCRYVVLYVADEPKQVYFAGYSFD